MTDARARETGLPAPSSEEFARQLDQAMDGIVSRLDLLLRLALDPEELDDLDDEDAPAPVTTWNAPVAASA